MRTIFLQAESKDWGACDEKVDLVLEFVLIFGEGIEHLTSTLGVANIGQFVNTANFKNFVDLGGEVVLSEFDE